MSVMDFDKELDEIRNVLQINPDSEQMTELIVICVGLFDRGMSFERDRVIHIVQRLAIDPMRIVKEIRKPIR